MENNIVVSFDLDGTLVNLDFSWTVWREAIPALVAEQKGIPLAEARTWVYEQYDAVGEGSLSWYDLSYWHKRFGLREDWQETLDRHRPLIQAFPEVGDVLENLGKSHRMIVLSNASHPFIEIEMEVCGLRDSFVQVISATSDFGEVKKTRAFYERVCRSLGLDPANLIHVGDHWEFDVLAPREAGIRAYFVDRSGETDGLWVLPDLQVFAERLLENTL
jgi:putative hydrolase of the HAD superfamily